MLLINGRIITCDDSNRVLHNYALRIVGSSIAEIAPQRELQERFPQDEQVDVNGQ